MDVISRTRANLPLIRIELAEGVAAYVRTLVALLAQAGIALSPRRAGMLFRSVLAVNAGALALAPTITPSDAALLAVRHGLPQRAQGMREIGRDHVCTPVTNAHLVCRLLLEKQKKQH